MKRKINQVGKATLTVSLPKTFIEKYNIEKGDNLYATLSNKAITYTVESSHKTIKKIEINVKNENLTFLQYLLTDLYQEGYDKVVLKNLSTPIEDILNSLLGAELLSQNTQETELFFFPLKMGNVQGVKRQIHYLIKDLLKGNKAQMTRIIKLISYHIRVLHLEFETMNTHEIHIYKTVFEIITDCENLTKELKKRLFELLENFIEKKSLENIPSKKVSNSTLLESNIEKLQYLIHKKKLTDNQEESTNLK